MTKAKGEKGRKEMKAGEGGMGRGKGEQDTERDTGREAAKS